MLVPLCTLALVGAIYFWKKGLLPENYSQFLVADGNKCRLSLSLGYYISVPPSSRLDHIPFNSPDRV